MSRSPFRLALRSSGASRSEAVAASGRRLARLGKLEWLGIRTATNFGQTLRHHAARVALAHAFGDEASRLRLIASALEDDEWMPQLRSCHEFRRTYDTVYTAAELEQTGAPRNPGVSIAPPASPSAGARGGECDATDLEEDGAIDTASARVFVRTTGDTVDGMAFDCAGNLYVGTLTGVEVYAPDATLLGTVTTGESSNATFGGADRRTLFVTSRSGAQVRDARGAGIAGLRRRQRRRAAALVPAMRRGDRLTGRIRRRSGR